MSHPIRSNRAGRVGVAFAVGLAFAAVPAAAHASAVNLATAGPFAVLGGSTVTSTGPTVLNGDLGVAPGTSLVGFGLPAVVNGATHANDAVARQAQLALTAAYSVAAGQPVAPADDLTSQNLGNRTLAAGAYRYSSSAQLTGTLTLDAKGDPNAQFVFEIGSTLTTAPASAVVLINGASPCNVYWQIGSSATLDTTTSFQGNLMALTDITLNNGASVLGRALARNGQVSLINNVVNRPLCAAGATTTPTPTPGAGTGQPGAGTSPGATSTTTHRGTAIMRRTPHQVCSDGFGATVRGSHIKRVVFTIDGRRLSSTSRSPFRVFVRASPGMHRLKARVTFKDATRARALTIRYRACAQIALHPRPGPSKFTG